MKKRKRSTLGKVVLAVIGIPLAAFLLLILVVTGKVIFDMVRPRSETPRQQTVQKEKTPEELIPFAIEDSPEDLELILYTDNRNKTKDKGKIIVYDMEALDRVLDEPPVTRTDLHEIIEKNADIDPQYKRLFTEYVDMALNRYPDLDLRVLYHNLKTLKVVEGDNDLMLASVSTISYGCYRIDRNTVYVKEGFEFQKKTWAYQVIMHELSHVARGSILDEHRRVGSEEPMYGIDILNEALNSLFTVHIFDYEERDIAYQLQSNMIQVMIESMDNYDYDDYMKHGNLYFIKKLDEWNGHHNYGYTMMKLMEVQYKDYHADAYELEQKYFYPLYDYIADMYYRAHITEDMSADEQRAAADQLVDQISFDVPEEYHLDTDEFYRYLETYVSQEDGEAES